MAYQKVGTCPQVSALCHIATSLLPPRHPGVGYDTVHDHRVRETFHPLLGDVLPGRWTHAFLSVIWRDGSIAPHCDSPFSGQRFHVALQATSDAWLLHDGVWTQVEEGCIYTMDPTIRHASVNWGHQPRVLLVIDLQPDDSPEKLSTLQLAQGGLKHHGS